MALMLLVCPAAFASFHASAMALGDGFLALHGRVVGVCVGRGSGDDVVEGLLVVDAGPWCSGCRSTDYKTEWIRQADEPS